MSRFEDFHSLSIVCKLDRLFGCSCGNAPVEAHLKKAYSHVRDEQKQQLPAEDVAVAEAAALIMKGENPPDWVIAVISDTYRTMTRA